MLDAYFEAFETFLVTGNADKVARFTDGDTNPAYLNVYRNGFHKTCTDALAASYPTVSALVGADYFRALARAYLNAYPPTKGTLVGYGSHFAEFLRSRSDEHRLAYLPDAAAIDATWLVSLFAEQPVALSPAVVETMGSDGIDVSKVRVTLTPPTQLVSLGHDIVETWIHIRQQGALSSAVNLHARDNTAMLWRLGAQVHIKALSDAEAAFLNALAGIGTLETAAVAALDVDNAFDLATTFAALLQNQILQLESHKE